MDSLPKPSSDSEPAREAVPCSALVRTPEVVGEYDFKGTLWPNSEWINGVDFFDWCPAVVFWNEKTQRLNARVTKSGDQYADFIGRFDGQWRGRRRPNGEAEQRGKNL